MTSGIAASRPSAVANSASAMPGATTASVVFFVTAIDWKLFMMPQTVPNRPTNGAVEPMVASEGRCRSSTSTSRSIVSSMNRVVRPLGELAVELVQGGPGPEGALEGVGLALEAEEPQALLEDHRPAPQR